MMLRLPALSLLVAVLVLGDAPAAGAAPGHWREAVRQMKARYRGTPVHEHKRGTPSAPRVRTGIEVLKANGFAPMHGMRVGLITNQTGIDSERVSTIDRLYHAPGVKLVKLFSPEHGIRGELEGDVEHGKDAKTGLK